MQMRLYLKRTLASFCLGLTMVGTGCSTEPVNTVQSPDQLSGLRLPGQTDNLSSPQPLASGLPKTITPRIRLKNVLAWEVKSSQKDAPVSLLIGTVYTAFSEDYSLPPKLNNQLQSSLKFFLEVDVSQANDELKKVEPYVFDKNRNNTQELTEQEWKTLNERLKPKTPEQALALVVYRPWYINQQLESPDADPAITADTVVDQVLRNQAEKGKSTIGFLESLSEQYIAIATALSDSEQMNYLKTVLAKPPQNPVESMNKLIDAYNRSDLSALEKHDQEARSENLKFYTAIVTNRNRKWVDLIVPELQKNSITVTVNIMNMIGPNGLVAELKQKGYQVTQVNP